MRIRVTPLAWSLTLVAFCFSAQAQQPAEPARRPPCPNSREITPADPKLAENSDAWIQENSSQDGIVSLSYCWVFQAGLIKARRLLKERLMELPANFDYHRRYAELIREKIRTDPLPIGFTVYKDLAFELETTVVMTGASMTLRLNVSLIRTGSGSDRPNKKWDCSSQLNLWPVAIAPGSDAAADKLR